MSREIPQSILDQKLNDVCRDCNQGWMNDLEQQAESTLVPLLRGQPTHVSSAQAAILATWAAKTAMVRARVDGDPYTVPEDHRTHIMTTNTPPTNLTAWAVTCEPHPNAMSRHHRIALHVAEPITETDPDGDTWVIGVENRQSKGHITTIVINHIALFIAEADSPTLHTELAVKLDPTGTTPTRLWPEPQEFKWPTAPVLTPNEVNATSEGTHPLPNTITR
ncbi:hypothetical protein OH782_00090 [Streptomyces sp. NBC_01544]|uniref:hypothetical protein n=1 Tax=Streptomyces sp. NBC_01544 TaxID=2975871 RepID=UPI00386D79FC